MIHPHTCIQYINTEIGYGVFATQFIPKGSIVYIKDSLEIEILEEDYHKHNSTMQAQIEKYSYIDEHGVRIISWDIAKYVNHCCNSNTLSTAYGFDISVRDIQAGEEITCDYGMLNVIAEMELKCSKPGCRMILKPSDFEHNYKMWDEKTKSALLNFFDIDQPLYCFVENDYLDELSAFSKDNSQYKSVVNLKYQGQTFTTPTLFQAADGSE